jgi:hypothetical protein
MHVQRLVPAQRLQHCWPFRCMKAYCFCSTAYLIPHAACTRLLRPAGAQDCKCRPWHSHGTLHRVQVCFGYLLPRGWLQLVQKWCMHGQRLSFPYLQGPLRQLSANADLAFTQSILTPLLAGSCQHAPCVHTRRHPSPVLRDSSHNDSNSVLCAYLVGWLHNQRVGIAVGNIQCKSRYHIPKCAPIQAMHCSYTAKQMMTLNDHSKAHRLTSPWCWPIPC